MIQRATHIVLVFILVQLTIGCATIINGSSQEIAISSTPDGAEVWIDGARMGMTPTKVTLKRKNDYVVAVKKEGFREATLKIESEVSPWIAGNILLGGLIGLGIDFASGGAYHLNPGQLDFNMKDLADLDGKTIHIGRARLDEIRQLRFLDERGKPEMVVNIAWVDG
jgi:hypothetical protein